MRKVATNQRHFVSAVVAVSCLGLVPATNATASTIEFGGSSGFPWTSPLIEKNGSAHAVNTAGRSVLRLTDDVGGQSGSAFFINPYIIGRNTDFVSNFVFQITSENSIPMRSDGLAFVISRSTTALGSGGEWLGYGGVNAISPSVIVEFDTYQNTGDPNDRHVGLIKNGDRTNHLPSISSTPTSEPMDNGHEWSVMIRYFGQGDLLTVDLADLVQPGVTARFSYNIDIPDVMGCGTAGCVNSFFGFTAGTGGGFANHDIVTWGPLYVPEPGSLPLLAVGGLVAFLGASRSRRGREDNGIS